MTEHRASEPASDLDTFRSYLGLLAHMQMPARVQARMDTSDIVQQTMLEAHQAKDKFRGTTKAEQAAWLRQILANKLAHALRDNRRQKRDVRRERALEASVNASSAPGRLAGGRTDLPQPESGIQ